MAREIDITGMIAIGNGEPCPFCANEDDRLVEDVFIQSPDNDIMQHMSDEHPSELNRALFSDPPPKPWLTEAFQLAIAKIGARLRFLEEEDKVNQSSFEEAMHNMYSVMKDYFDESK